MVNFKILNFIILDIFLMFRKIGDRFNECLKADVNKISLVVVCVYIKNISQVKKRNYDYKS